MTTPILKKYWDLTAEDLRSHPVWKSCVDDRWEPWHDDDEVDSETVRPWPGALPAVSEETQLYVAVTFRLADGTELPGFATPKSKPIDPENLLANCVYVYAILPGRPCAKFWHGVRPPPAEWKAEFYAALGKGPDQVFPMTFAAHPGLTPGFCEGTIPGFLALETPYTRQVRAEV